MMEGFYGIWKNVKGSDSNMSAFLKACELSEALAKSYRAREYEVTLEKGDTDREMWTTVKVLNESMLARYSLHLDKENEHVDTDGANRKAKIKWVGNELVEEYITCESGFKLVVTRSKISGDRMKVTLSANGASTTNEWVRC